MKPNILLVNVADPWLRNGGDRPSLGTLYIASWLRYKNAAEPSVIDLNHHSDKDLIGLIKSLKPKYIGISLTTPQYEESVRVAELIKGYTSTPIIAGGPHITAMQNVPKIPELMPLGYFDYCVTGAGERTLEKICIEGLPNQRIIKGEDLPTERSLDWLPEPARDLVDMNRYSLHINGKKATPIMTSFGCPWHCSFCSEPILNNRFKAYSPERVVQELKGLKEKYNVESFIAYDDVYSIDSPRAIKIADLMIQEGLNMNYRVTTRATDFIRNPNLAHKLMKSGCLEVCIGLESGDDAMLKMNDKGMSTYANRKAIQIIQGAGMKALTYMITGLPGVSRESEERSYQFIQETQPDEVGHYMLAPFPSTPIWVNRDKYGIEVFEDEIIANKWDVAQCRADNENLRCYIDYSKSGGLDRHHIKALWLEYRHKYDTFLRSKGKSSIQQSEDKTRDTVK